jgi:hypothetical protein
MIVWSFEHNLLPVIELFSDRPRALEYLATHGCAFPGICDETSSAPMAFMLCFGTQEQAQGFLTHYFLNLPSGGRGNIRKTFEAMQQALQQGQDIKWNFGGYMGNTDMTLACAYGLSLPEK